MKVAAIFLLFSTIQLSAGGEPSKQNTIQMKCNLGKVTNLGPPAVSIDFHLVKNLFRDLI